MSMAEKNQKVEMQVKNRIKQLGYEGRLEMDPISNSFKRRNHFTQKSDGTGVFTAFMWQMNKLSDSKLAADIDSRIYEAAKHFQLK